MEVNQALVQHLAALSNFALSESQSKSLEADIKNILNYISQLDDLDTTGIEPTYQVFEMTNVWREDEIKPQEADREALLALTKATEDYQIKVPKVL